MEHTKYKLPDGFSDLGESVKTMSMDGMDSDEGKESTHYPCLYFSGKESLKNLPKSGTAVIHFKKIMERQEETTKNGETKKTYSVELEIHGIKPMESDDSYEEKGETEKDDESAIDKGLEDAEESK